MKYIVCKFLNIDNLKIKENKTIFKIIYSDKNIELYGITFKLNYKYYIENYNNYEFILYNNDIIYKYSDFLKNNINNLRPFITNNKIKIDKYKIKKRIIDNCNIYINISYVKKSGFLNIPMINII